jgi:hypothetical protein
MTANAMRGAREEGLAAGYVINPIRVDHRVEALTRMSARNRRDDQE